MLNSCALATYQNTLLFSPGIEKPRPRCISCPSQTTSNEKNCRFSLQQNSKTLITSLFFSRGFAIHVAQQGFPKLQYIKITKFDPELSTVFSHFADPLQAEMVKTRIFSVISTKLGFLDFPLRTHHRPQKNNRGLYRQVQAPN